MNYRIWGLMAVMSYLIVILATWMYANYTGHIYFMAGEPNIIIKYVEWVLAGVGMYALVDILRKELNEMIV